MQLLEERILKDGKLFPGNILKVDSFLNHQMDIGLLNEIGKEFHRLFADGGVNKILTIESSGIGIACIAAQYFNCPVLFAKKTKTKNIASSVFKTQVKSFTHGTTYDVIVSKEFLHKTDRILIIDGFLAQAAVEIVKKTKRHEELTDIRPWIYELRLQPDNRLYLLLSAGSVHHLKPELVWSALCDYAKREDLPRISAVHRIDLYAGTRDAFVPLSSLGEEF